MMAVEQSFSFYPDNIPDYLKTIPRWAPWRASWNQKRKKWDKIPQSASNPEFGLSTAKPDKWSAFDKALSGFNPVKSAGLGFVMTGIKGLVAIDLDNCLGEDWALEIIQQVNSYTEISPSGKGYRVFVKGDLDQDWTNHERGIEVYAGNEARFLTVTGAVVGSRTDVTQAPAGVLEQLTKQYAKEKRKADVIYINMPDLIAEADLPKLEDLRIPEGPRRFLMTGEFDGDRSGTLFGAGVSLFAGGYTDQEVFSLLALNDYAMEVALDHRRQDHDRALLYLWCEHCIKAKAKAGNAVASADEFEFIPVDPSEKPLPRFTRDGKGRIESTINNVVMALDRPDLCGIVLRYDRFRDEIMFALDGRQGEWQQFTDADYSRLRITLEKRGFKPIGRELIRDSVLLIADDHPFDSAIEWLGKLEWDGVQRIGSFLSHYFNTEDTEYTRAVSMYLWSAMAGRVMVPGIKADMVPILIGAQGSKKSSSVAAMSPNVEFFTEISFHEKDEDLARKMRGRLLGEIGELRGLHTKDQESIKAFITRTHENWIPKYREFSMQFARRIVFIATTNQDQFLSDETGNRRWLPVRVGEADIDAIKRDRDQLWAEANWWFDLFGVMYQDAERLGVEEHDEYVMPERWEEPITAWLDEADHLTGETPRTREFLRTHSVATECLRLDPARITRADEIQVGKVLQKLGFTRKKKRMADGKLVWAYLSE